MRLKFTREGGKAAIVSASRSLLNFDLLLWVVRRSFEKLPQEEERGKKLSCKESMLFFGLVLE